MSRTDSSPAGVLVTGGARGIGRGIAERLAKRGDTVFIADIAGEKEASAELREAA